MFHKAGMAISLLLFFIALTLSFIVNVKASPTTWIIETVDAAADVGIHSSITIDSDGFPHIAYHDSHWENLKYATPSRVGTGWVIQPVDTPGKVGEYPSIALDSDDHIHISYYDLDNRQLKYAKWITGPNWTIDTVVVTEGLSPSSLALDSNGFPHISYAEWVAPQEVILRYARWNGVTWVIETVDSTIDFGGFSSLALDSNDDPHISYCDQSNWQLKYAHWSQGTWIIETIDAAGGSYYHSLYNSLALDSEQRPHISYYQSGFDDFALKYIHWTGTAWSDETIDTTVGQDRGVSLDLDWLDRPHISYCDGEVEQLRYARWFGGAWIIETIDSATAVWDDPALALDSEGKPHISYHDHTNSNLKYASNSNEYFAGVNITPFDSDDDGLNNALEIEVNVDTMDVHGAYSGTVPVELNAFLVDPFGYHADFNTMSWTVTGYALDWREIYLSVPTGYFDGPSMFNVELSLFDEDGFFEDFHHELDLYLYPGSTPPLAPIIESCNWMGEYKDVFYLGETVYLYGNGFSPSTEYNVYVVIDQEIWIDGVPIPERVSGTGLGVSSNTEGHISPIAVWTDPQIVGYYDIIVDVNGNGHYDEGVDALDDADVAEAAGVSVIPELPTILPLFFLLTLLPAILLRKKI